jgi:hypothetical protein
MCHIERVSELHRFVAREKTALLDHREALRGAMPPDSSDVVRGTFVHGFLLPFSLIVSTLRCPALRGSYLRLTALRAAVVVVIAGAALANGYEPKEKKPEARIVVRHEVGHAGDGAPKKDAVHVHVPGVHIDLGGKRGENHVSILGRAVPIEEIDAEDAAVNGEDHARSAAPAAAPPGVLARAAAFVDRGWTWLLALLGLLSGVQFVVVALSRRYDDWLSFHASRLASVLPEDETPKTPKVALDLRWLKKKIYRRLRGYVVFAAGFPLLMLFRLVPSVGTWLFSLAVMLWGWYWLGVFTAAKSAHAWADDGRAPPPLLLRSLEAHMPERRLLGPFRWYTRIWARLTRGVYPPASAFERAPAPFLGLALARVVLSLPGLYLLARPLVPVAAGRLCAEADPWQRFYAPSAPREPSEPTRAPSEPTLRRAS